MAKSICINHFGMSIVSPIGIHYLKSQKGIKFPKILNFEIFDKHLMNWNESLSSFDVKTHITHYAQLKCNNFIWCERKLNWYVLKCKCHWRNVPIQQGPLHILWVPHSTSMTAMTRHWTIFHFEMFQWIFCCSSDMSNFLGHCCLGSFYVVFSFLNSEFTQFPTVHICIHIIFVQIKLF